MHRIMPVPTSLCHSHFQMPPFLPCFPRIDSAVLTIECACLQAVTKIMRDPTVVKDLVRLNGINSETAQKMLQDLQGDVQQCVDCDQVYSPQADAKRLQLGEPSHALAMAYAPAHRLFQRMSYRAATWDFLLVYGLLMSLSSSYRTVCQINKGLGEQRSKGLNECTDEPEQLLV